MLAGGPQSTHHEKKPPDPPRSLNALGQSQSYIHSAPINQAHSYPLQECLPSESTLYLPVDKVSTHQPLHADPGQRQLQKRKLTVVTLHCSSSSGPVPPSKDITTLSTAALLSIRGQHVLQLP